MNHFIYSAQTNSAQIGNGPLTRCIFFMDEIMDLVDGGFGALGARSSFRGCGHAKGRSITSDPNFSDHLGHCALFMLIPF